MHHGVIEPRFFQDDTTRKKCYELVEEARGRTSMNMEEKRKKKRKEAIAKGLPPSGELFLLARTSRQFVQSLFCPNFFVIEESLAKLDSSMQSF